jgi:hypothetical protein
LWCAGDGDAASASEFEQLFTAQGAQRAQDGVRVDAQDRREVFGERQSLASLCMSLSVGLTDLVGRGLRPDPRRLLAHLRWPAPV